MSIMPATAKAIITGRMIGGASPSQAEPKYMGWGTGAGAAGMGSTDLSTPATEARVAAVGSQATTTYTNDTHVLTGTMTANGTKIITNIAFFDAAGSGSPPSGGNPYSIFDGLTSGVAINDQITFIGKHQFT